jgi:signal transduction histidine kinase
MGSSQARTGDSLRNQLAKTQLWQKLVRFHASQSPTALRVEAITLVLAIGIIDYITSYEVTFFPFYSIPILLAVWFGSRRFAMLTSILCTIAWWTADVVSGHHYSNQWYHIGDAMGRFLFFLLVIVSGSAVREHIELLERSQKLEHEIIRISEREQQRIGRDLHDGLGQYLVAIGLAADSLRNDLEKNSLQGAKESGKIADLLHDAVLRVRDLSRGLSPVDRDEGGLKAALKELATSISQLAGIPCSFIFEGNIPISDNAAAVHLYRIAQEALSNAIKHAKPKLLVIAFEARDEFMSLRISDDGIGLDASVPRKHGMGFNIMRYRARMLGGSLEVEANSPTGTIVVCSVKTKARELSNTKPRTYE